MLTPEALAHFIMGDGTSDQGRGVVLCTDSERNQPSKGGPILLHYKMLLK